MAVLGKKTVDSILKGMTKSIQALDDLAKGNRKEATDLVTKANALDSEAERAEQVVKNFQSLLAVPTPNPVDDSANS